jgi:hypothetical protein
LSIEAHGIFTVAQFIINMNKQYNQQISFIQEGGRGYKKNRLVIREGKTSLLGKENGKFKQIT